MSLAPRLAFLVLAGFATCDLSAQVPLEASLSGAFETPPNGSVAGGRATATYDIASGVLSCSVTVSGLSPGAVHVHDGDAGVAGPVLFGLSGGPTTWTGASAPLSATELTDLLHDGLYVNVHTPAFSSGELRGQLVLRQNLRATLSGANETPPVVTAAMGTARIHLDQPAGTLTYVVETTGLTGSAAHIHDGDVGSPGPIVTGLLGGPTVWAGTSPPLCDAEILELYRGGYYINVHNPAFPAGMIRGQIEIGGLNVDGSAIGTTNGGVQTFEIEAGAAHAGELYFLLGSTGGSSPGFAFQGFGVPLNIPDVYFSSTLNAPNLPPLMGSLGVLDASGSATATLTVPPASGAFAGLTLTHAAASLTLAPITLTSVSNAVSVDLLP